MKNENTKSVLEWICKDAESQTKEEKYGGCLLMKYSEALFNPNISWADLVGMVRIPDRLYKYQSFYSGESVENKFWKNNLQGEFHLSLGCEFEDTNDCRPYINKGEIEEYLIDFFKSGMHLPKEEINRAVQEFKEAFDEGIVQKIVNNYQSNIRIGCFTDSFRNKKMWMKYGNNATGFCIEYNTHKAELFMLSTLPVLYTGKAYDLSMNYAYSLLVECCRLAKKRSMEEQSQIYKDIYKKIIKTAYIPLFLKSEKEWSFEHEYRMFILKNRNTPNGILKMEEVLDENYNIDLSRSINAVYLGNNFDQNKSAHKLYDMIMEIRDKMKGNPFNIYKINRQEQAEKQI